MLKNRAAIVTGGSRGIGRAIVLDLVRNGAKVVFTYLKSAEAAAILLDEIKEMKGEAEAVKSDSREYAQAKGVIDETLKKFGHLDILVNNAGIIKDKALMFMEPSEWRDVIETNLTGYFNMAKACIVTMMKQKSGNIINISSVAGVVGTPRQVNYASAKAGIVGLTKSLAKEVASYNIRVNAVAPGYIETDMTKDLKNKEALLKLIPSGRLGRPDEVAKVVSFLASDKSGYITGQVIKVDGGLAI
ncbi:MAG: 3-oxoacyl-[acyl-carrier-protein] reductase [Candidatus Omnitrophica bacterium]|nr:3-oxoacyl-[acyl-carrier-protein] reductase [Candidatus Omnitrophota bacterium]